MRKENKMGVMPIPKLVITMALPLMLSLLVQSLYNIVDGIFVAKISEEAFTATSLAYPVQLLMVAVSVGTGVGVNAVVSRMVGAKRYDDANRAATTGLVLSLIGTLVFMIFGAFFLKFYIRTCSGSENALAMCESYLRICTLFCLGVFLETLGQRLLQAVGNTFLSMISLIAGAVTNIILDPVLIFACHMGIEGAAVATVIGQWVGAAVALILNAVTNHEVKFAIKGFRMRKDTVWPIYKVGLPTILTQAMGAIMLFSMNAILGMLLPGVSDSGTANSAPAIAFFGGYYKLQNFLFMPIMGLGQAAIPIVGFNYGAKNSGRIKQVLRTAVPVAMGIGLLGTILFEAIPGPLLKIFSASEAALAIGVPGLRIIAVTFILGSVTTVLGYTCSGLGNGMVNMVGTCLRQFIPLVPLAFLFGKLDGVSVVWYAMWVSELLAVLFSILATRSEFRKKVASLETAQA
ncbi:MAG: MATE family efflux transporter [Candidatus Avoscillospira sp.]